MNVAYIRNVGNYIENSALFEKLFGQLCGWAGPKGLLGQSDMSMLSVYYDDPKKTENTNNIIKQSHSNPPTPNEHTPVLKLRRNPKIPLTSTKTPT